MGTTSAPKRCYFGSATDGTTPAFVANGSWTLGSTTHARRCMPRKSLYAGQTVTESFTAGQTKEVRRFLFDEPLRAGPITGTVKCQIVGFESNADDNIRPRLELYVVSADLTTVRGTLLSIANYGSGNEFATSATNIVYADGDAMTRVDAQAGDRLVAYIGAADTTGTTPSASLYFGGTEADAPEDESTTGNRAGWIEFSDGSIFVDVPTLVGYVSNPVDSSTATNTADPTAVTPLSAFQEGDLVIMVGQERASAATLAVQQASGQAWVPLSAINNTNITVRLFYCRFNGTWGSDPSVNFASAVCNTVVFFGFRPTQQTNQWGIDQPLVELDFTAGSTPFTKTITGQTTTKPNTVTVAIGASADDNTYNAMVGPAWMALTTNAGGSQFRNTSGSDQSMFVTYKVQHIAGATGNMSINQATLGGDAGTTLIVTFYEYPPVASAVGTPTSVRAFSGTTGDLSETGITVNPGDFLVLLLNQYNSGGTSLGTPALPSGLVSSWTQIDGAGNAALGQAWAGYAYYGVATSGSTLTQTLGTSHTDFRGELFVVPGGDSIGVHSAATAVATGSVSTSLAGALSSSIAMASVYASGGNGADPRPGWTELSDVVSFQYFEAQWITPADTTASATATFGGARDMSIVAFEVKGKPLPAPPPQRRYPAAAMQAATW